MGEGGESQVEGDTGDSSMNTIYLDHNATSPLLPEVNVAMQQVVQLGPLNPSSQHRQGRRAKQLWEEARESIGLALQAASARLMLTSGGTESNCAALYGLAALRPGPLVVATTEHPSVTEPARWLASQGRELRWLEVDRHGLVQLEQLEHYLRQAERPAIVAVMHANNETGVLQPLEQIADLCRRSDVWLHVDAAQTAGKLAVNWGSLGCATVSISAHKLGGPVGVGGLLIDRALDLPPLLRGGTQQRGRRAGTEPVALAVGLRVALEQWGCQRDRWLTQLERQRDHWEQVLRQGDPQLMIQGEGAPRLPNTSNLAWRGLDRQALLMRLDLEGVFCSTGSACSSGSSEPSPVLRAMRCPEEVISSAVRFSFGPQTEGDLLSWAAGRILALVKDLRSSCWDRIAFDSSRQRDWKSL